MKAVRLSIAFDYEHSDEFFNSWIWKTLFDPVIRHHRCLWFTAEEVETITVEGDI